MQFLLLYVLCVLQLNTKKRFVYGAIAFIWIAIPTFVTATSAVSTNIVEGRCVAYGTNLSAAGKKSIGFFTNFIVYFLPLALMAVCYARIVHALRSKVFLAARTDACSMIGYWHNTVVCLTVRLFFCLFVCLCDCV